MQEDVVFKRRNRLKKHFVNTSNVLLYCYQLVSDAAKITFQVVDSFDWESKETGDSKGYVFPAVETIARLRHASDRTIRRHILELIKAKLLTRIRQRNKPSILYIEEVSEDQIQEYFIQINPNEKKISQPQNDFVDKSRTDKNVHSDNLTERTKMSIAYRDKENELKENEINVNEDFKTFKNDGIKKPNRGQGTTSLRDILIQYKLDIPRKVKSKAGFRIKTLGIDKNQRDYLASEIADKLNDQKSLGCFRVIAEKVPQPVIFEVLSSIKETDREGRITVSRGALFVDVIKGYCKNHSIDLGFTKNNQAKIYASG